MDTRCEEFVQWFSWLSNFPFTYLRLIIASANHIRENCTSALMLLNFLEDFDGESGDKIELQSEYKSGR